MPIVALTAVEPAGLTGGAARAGSSLELAAGSERSNNPDAFIDDFDVPRPNGRRIARESTFTNLLALAEPFRLHLDDRPVRIPAHG